MKQHLVIVYALTLLACQKQSSKENSSTNLPRIDLKAETCDFLKGKYNRIRRGELFVNNLTSGRLSDIDGDGVADNIDNCKTTYNPTQTDTNKDGIGDACDKSTVVVRSPTITPASWVLYLDFDGQNLKAGMWNGGIPFNVAPSGFSSTEIDNIFAQVKNDFSVFPNIKVTIDANQYWTAARTKRQRVIITQSNEWYTGGAGAAYLGSWTWGSDVPAFVFSMALDYNEKYVWEATSHEAGHAAGLNHQSKYGPNCELISEYNGGGNGQAPIMGVSYYQPIGKWWIGSTITCDTKQDDARYITGLTK